jgi:hypothetical protein
VHANAVVDNVTGLIWQEPISSQRQSWDQAKSYCAGLGPLDGVAGWRLPTVIELLSIVDYSRDSPCINVAVFPTTTLDLFWTSTPYPGGGSAWDVYFVSGFTGYTGATYPGSVRCVH